MRHIADEHSGQSAAYAMQVRCANAAACGADVTQLFVQKGIIAVAYRRPVRPGRRTP